MDSIKYWTGEVYHVTTDYVVKDGNYYIPVNGIYYLADESRVMKYAADTADGYPLYDKDIISYTEKGIEYRSPIALHKKYGTFMIIAGNKSRLLTKFLEEHKEASYAGNAYDALMCQKRTAAEVADISKRATRQREVIDDGEAVCIYIASTKAKDGEERGYAKWSYIMIRGEKYAQKVGEGNLTANRAYLTAVISALCRVAPNSTVHLYTRSKYITEPFEKGWLSKWKNAGWLRSDLEPVQNAEEWQRIDALTSRYEINMHWVDRKHDNNPMMDRCEKLIYEGANEKKYA